LTAASLPILDAAVESLKRHPDVKLRVAGHTDSSGDNALNMDLSSKRALSVMKYLISKGIGSGNLTASGFGETKPIADNSTAEGRSQNRRVELEVRE
jgi:OOP family OmpA-OmpF porin